MGDSSKKRLRVSIHQPGYHRYLGYFYKIYKSDLFISFDTVQYVPREWQNRQRFYFEGRYKWLSVPVNKGRDLIKNKTITNQKIIQDHWCFIKQLYKNTPYFSYYSKDLEQIYLEEKWFYLNDLCDAITLLALKILGINTKVIRDSEFGSSNNDLKKADKLIDSIKRVIPINKHNEVIYLPRNHPIPNDFYLNQKFNNSPITEIEKFYKSNINIETYIFAHPRYRQYQYPNNQEFIQNLSVFDLIFNNGPESLKVLISGGDDKYISERG